MNRVVAVLAAAMLIGGCAEMITYSKRSQETGQSLFAQGRYEEAAGAFRDSVKQNPRNYEAFYYLGVCYDKLGREQQALQSFHTALDVLPASLDPMDTEIWAFREQAVNGLAEFVSRSASKDAELTAMDAKARQTRKPLDWYVLARTHVAAGDADSAIDAYDQAFVTSDKRDQPIAKSFGLYLAQTNQTRRAESVLTQAYRLNPGDREVNAALRKLGVVPGPSLLDQSQLNSPVIPKGPIPELKR